MRRSSPFIRRCRQWSAGPAADRELLPELKQARTAVNRYGVNVNQAVAALRSVGNALLWLEKADPQGLVNVRWVTPLSVETTSTS